MSEEKHERGEGENELFYVSIDDDGDLVVMKEREDGNDVVVSDKYETKFMLCSGRCARKEHYGQFNGKTFKCYYYDCDNTHPLHWLVDSLIGERKK